MWWPWSKHDRLAAAVVSVWRERTSNLHMRTPVCGSAIMMSSETVAACLFVRREIVLFEPAVEQLEDFQVVGCGGLIIRSGSVISAIGFRTLTWSRGECCDGTNRLVSRVRRQDFDQVRLGSENVLGAGNVVGRGVRGSSSQKCGLASHKRRNL